MYVNHLNKKGNKLRTAIMTVLTYFVTIQSRQVSDASAKLSYIRFNQLFYLWLLELAPHAIAIFTDRSVYKLSCFCTSNLINIFTHTAASAVHFS